MPPYFEQDNAKEQEKFYDSMKALMSSGHRQSVQSKKSGKHNSAVTAFSTSIWNEINEEINTDKPKSSRHTVNEAYLASDAVYVEEVDD